MRPELAAHHFEAMGTSCAVFAIGACASVVLNAERWVRALATRLTRFDETSELSQLNAAAGRWFDVSPELEALLRESLRAYEMSAGLVNVAVLPAMLAIGYTRPFTEGPTAQSPRPPDSVPPLPDVLDVATAKVRLAPGAQIDLGGIAKGWLADELALRLGGNILVNLGGDLRAAGGGPDGEGWPVEVGGRTLLLQDHGAATSSVLRRRWGRGVHHLIDPRTGRPAETGLVEVSVVTRTAVDAEIVAKAALLAGPEGAPAFCATHADAWWLRRPE